MLRLDVAVELRVGELAEGLHLEALVACRARRPAAGRRCRGCGRSPSPGVPAPRSGGSRSWQSEVDLVAEPRPAPRARLGVVDVRAGAAQQLAVEDQDAHGPGYAVDGGYRDTFARDAEPAPDLPPARPRLGPRGPRRRPSPTASTSTARPARRWSRSPGPAARAVGLGAAAHARRTSGLPPLRPADRRRRQRLPVLRAPPAGAQRRLSRSRLFGT